MTMMAFFVFVLLLAPVAARVTNAVDDVKVQNDCTTVGRPLAPRVHMCACVRVHAHLHQVLLPEVTTMDAIKVSGQSMLTEDQCFGEGRLNITIPDSVSSIEDVRFTFPHPLAPHAALRYSFLRLALAGRV